VGVFGNGLYHELILLVGVWLSRDGRELSDIGTNSTSVPKVGFCRPRSTSGRKRPLAEARSVDRPTAGTIANECGVHHDTIEHALETSLSSCGGL
jgi:hypothetical protein